MGKHSRKDNKRKRLLTDSPGNLETRQRRRAAFRRQLWKGISGEMAIRDDHGIIKRSIRRDMWRLRSKLHD